MFWRTDNKYSRSTTIGTATTTTCATKGTAAEQAPVETDINPQVRENKSKKARNEMSQGTSELRIPLEGSANTGGANTGQGGGLNK